MTDATEQVDVVTIVYDANSRVYRLSCRLCEQSWTGEPPATVAELRDAHRAECPG